MFGFMHEIWTIPTANVMYTRLQNYTNLMVGENAIQTFDGVVVLVVAFDVIV